MAMYNKPIFVANLKAQIKHSGYSYDELAKILDVSTSLIYQWLGKTEALPSLPNLYQLARLFGTTIDALIDGAILPDGEKPVPYGNRVNDYGDRIIAFYNDLPAGSYFTLGTISMETGLTKRQINTAKVSLPAVAQLLGNTRISRRDYQKPHEKYDAPTRAPRYK